MAVIVEGGGYGSRSAAPIAAALVLKAKELGYFNTTQPAQKPGGAAPRRQATPRPRQTGVEPRARPGMALNASQQ